MKITILQENLNSGLSTVDKFISTKVQLPILSNILLSAEKGKLKLSATNLETGINLWLPAKVEKKGKITIPAKVLSEFVSSLPADKVNLNLNKNRLEVVCRNYKAQLNGISAEEYPAIPSLKTKDGFKTSKKINLKTDSFIKAINQVAFTAAVDESRPVLTGVRLAFLNKKVQFVATDGYRLSVKTIKLKKAFKDLTLIISSRALLEIARISGQQEKDEVSLNLPKKQKQIIFSFDNVEIISRLIEGEFPDFEKIVPQDNLTDIKVETEEFEKAIKTAAIFARDSANIIRFEVKGNKLKVSANAPDVGENEVELEINKNGEDSKIAFNSRFLQEYLQVLDNKEFVLETSGPLKPGVFRPVKDSSYLHLIMPVRLQE